MFLTHNDYKELTKEDRVVPNVKAKIKSFVGKGKKSYEDIVKHVQKTDNMTNDEIIKQVNEVKQTKDFTPVVEEEVVEA